MLINRSKYFVELAKSYRIIVPHLRELRGMSLYGTKCENCVEWLGAISSYMLSAN
jgi:hypothetical protein